MLIDILYYARLCKEATMERSNPTSSTRPKN
jgi:hypothetical protein